MSLKHFSTIALALISASAFSACGKEEEKRPANPLIIEGLSLEERAQYCVLKIEPEAEATRKSILDQLKGTWTNYPAETHANYRKREFRLDLEIALAAVTDYYDLGKDVKDIGIKKLCLSKELDSTYGAYAGYRFIEFMAKNNEGGAAVLFKIERPPGTEKAPSLRLSEEHYSRWAADRLENPPEAAKLINRVWVYREHKY